MGLASTLVRTYMGRRYEVLLWQSEKVVGILPSKLYIKKLWKMRSLYIVQPPYLLKFAFVMKKVCKNCVKKKKNIIFALGKYVTVRQPVADSYFCLSARCNARCNLLCSYTIVSRSGSSTTKTTYFLKNHLKPHRYDLHHKKHIYL